ncbi:MAG TPA: helix-turn-helix domain-containing protein [Caulobacteraceae bacterium]|jgi:AcrR family transcriptional regulator|nr:helix-turn-helix domain-containing protein [Caulobacteraceae bacterium]
MPTQSDRRAATIALILAEARRLFAERGFESTSIDEIAAAAGVAKGAVYHHFESKEALFQRVLEEIQAGLLAAPIPAEALAQTDPTALIVGGVLGYLLAASEPDIRRILLIDGPAVIGWRRWREIDDRYFGAGARLAMRHLLGEGASEKDVEATTHLVMGAVMEAALVCATAEDPRTAAQELCAALRPMLVGLTAKPPSSLHEKDESGRYPP